MPAVIAGGEVKGDNITFVQDTLAWNAVYYFFVYRRTKRRRVTMIAQRARFRPEASQSSLADSIQCAGCNTWTYCTAQFRQHFSDNMACLGYFLSFYFRLYNRCHSSSFSSNLCSLIPAGFAGSWL